jgi:hypothetical protein
MNVSTEVLNQLSVYLSGKLSLQSLREWEVALFLRRRELAEDDQKFLMAFERHFAELSLGLPEDVFNRMLRSLVEPSMVVVQVMVRPAELLLNDTSTTHYPSEFPRLLPNIPELSPA